MRHSIVAILCAAAGLMAGAAGQAVAASLSGGYTLGGLGCSASGQGSGTISNISCSNTTMTSGSFAASGSGQASYDTLRATASVGISGDPAPFVGNGSLFASARGTARADDQLTIDIAGRTGELVDLVFTTALNGAMSATSGGYEYSEAGATLSVTVKGFRVNVSRNAKSSGTPANNDFNPGRVQIQLGTPFSVSSQLSAYAEILRNGTSPNGIYSGDAVADFGNSGGITGFQLFEPGEGGALIPAWILTSESGQFGFYDATAVPIPAGGWLLLPVVAVIGRYLRPRRARNTPS